MNALRSSSPLGIPRGNESVHLLGGEWRVQRYGTTPDGRPFLVMELREGQTQDATNSTIRRRAPKKPPSWLGSNELAWLLVATMLTVALFAPFLRL